MERSATWDPSFATHSRSRSLDPIDGTGSFNAGGQTCLGSKYSYGADGQFYYGGFAANGPNGSVAPGTFALAGFKFQAADGTHFG